MPLGFGKPPRRDRKPATALAQAAEMFDLGLVLHRQGRLAEAIVRYGQALDFQADYVEAHFALGLALQAQGNLDGAIDHLQRAIELRSYYTDAHFALGTALHEKGRLKEAVAAYERVLAIEPEYVKAHNNLGAVQRELGALDEAVASCRRAIALDPGYVEAHNNLGVALKDQGERSEAAACFKRALTLQPDFAEAYYNLGLVLQAQQQWSEAAAVYRTALLLKPDLAEAQTNLANAQLSLGQVREAIESFEAALALAPWLAAAHRGLGNARRDLGQLAQAAAAYTEAIRLDPADSEARHYLAAVGGAPVPPAADPRYVAALFDDYAERFDAHLLEDLAYSTPRQLLEAVRAAAPHANHLLNILDLGCGTGLCGPLFKPLAHRLVGIDLSSRMIEKARARAVYDELVTGEIGEQLAHYRDAFDLIVAADVFPYLGDLLPVLVASAVTLVPGGLLAFSVEAGPEEDYLLQPSGRYAHALSYLRQAAAFAEFVEVSAQQSVLRTDKGEPIAGWIVVLRSRR
ncbi:tetratricopeptide repeat protein [Gloeobacter kilaueensis]|uniref:Cellulose synthase subunit BcsC n=1 Tax=Gloeobacter kilaueensis (strain ATCC BAA-2537 / CCAP 1431/1 / ULC 316 / JS1) TaxID=1183438 RepID=U5QGU9_GLOK1|nr:tetratricopeptide repeat protein [Gloeobacter kilaueensis]AGY58171.1 cellulose synthase subunit BcsC [Gloeobacter kilaueensis JS1]